MALTEAMEQLPPIQRLLDECWLYILRYSDAQHLCACGGVNVRLATLSNSDDLWRALCNSRWVGKLRMPDDLFIHGDYQKATLSASECKSLFARRGVQFRHICEKPELVAAVHASTLRSSNPKLRPLCWKWKTSYIYAELDSQRGKISAEEVSYYRWHLTYNGMPSSLGLRHFQRNGTFVSPHLGETTWFLNEDGSFVMRGIAPLTVERNSNDWGWIIGRGTATEYRSIEV